MRYEKVVVIGGGPAAAECAASLRMSGFSGSITVVTADKNLPYGLPPLSKAYLLGTATLDDILIKPASTYHRHDITVRCGVRAEFIDRASRRVRLADGSYLPYDKLVIATGGRPRELPATIVQTAVGVHYLRTFADAESIRTKLHSGSRLVVVGGGYLGLEVAAVARKLGAAVTVVEAAPRLLARVTSAPVSTFFERVHLEEGVDLRLADSVIKISTAVGGKVVTVELSSGDQLTADAVLISVGLVPAVELAQDAGLEVTDGIVVDQHCRTSDPAIFAAGDCASHPCIEDGGRRRLESLPNANEQAAVAAASVMGLPTPHVSTPWFWSEQYDVLLQSVGLAQPTDDVIVRGSAKTGRSFAVFYLRQGQVRAADVVSNPRDFASAKKMVAHRTSADPDVLRNQTIALKELVGHSSQRAPNELESLPFTTWAHLNEGVR